MKNLRKINKPVINNGIWSGRRNEQLTNLYGEAYLVAEVKEGRLQCLGHIIKRDNDRVANKL